MILEDVGKQLSHVQIEAFEKDLKITLPQDYKDFLLKNNGGYVAHGGTFDFVEDPETGYLLMSLVANSFSELISICYEYTDVE